MNLAKTYNPDQFEPTTYALWETSGAFAPRGTGQPYGVVMPPPNANGNLHIGHALDMNLKDILVRYHRMKGDDAVFIPGADHAGFETWVVYEKELEKQGKSRFDFSREQLYSQVWNFVDEKRGDMDLQLRALGLSASWEDLVFSLDKKVISTVYDTFKQLWDDGLIYRGERIVNYCTKHQTSFADIEVEHREEKTKLWKIAYPLLEKEGELVVATTRPETKLGQSALMVHPDDERYKHYIGMHVVQPLVPGVEIPIIGDEHVDPAYGTGVVTVTPAHDVNDFEVAEKHQLPLIQLIGFDGRMTENVPTYFRGLTVMEARKKIIPALEAVEALRGSDDISHNIGHCYKCGTVIEPLVKDQWFIKVKPLADKAIQALEANNIEFTPASRQKVLVSYLKNLRDWNISRQIPWGIPIPAFQNINDPSDWLFDVRVDEPTIEVDGKIYTREEDTFDTWFSSGQWPFITTDYLEGGELARFYPNAIMETGSDLLDRWVARMIMLGLYRTDDVPFRDVYVHGMVLDEKGQKMSKSKGNVINPMEMVAKHGSDALRLGIIANRSAAQNQAFSEGKVVAGRNFCNKLWNIARYIEGKLGESYQPRLPKPHSLADHWIISRLEAATNDIDAQLADYRFSEAGETVYHAIWDDVADWYIEASKTTQSLDMLAYVLDTSLKLAHPFAPFVTETIWQSLSWHNDLLIVTPWPKDFEYNAIAAATFTRLQALVTEARFVTAELPGNGHYPLLYLDDSLVADNAELIKHLARVTDVQPIDTPRGLRLAASGRDAWLDVDSDTLYEHQGNLEVRLATTRQELAALEARLANKTYVEKAPANLVDETRAAIIEKTALIERYSQELTSLS